jgi:hypothetical protein
MAQTINQLTARKVLTLKEPGYHADGAGLWLQVTQAGGKSWIFTYSLRGRAREMGLGSASRVTLAEARAERDKCNRLLREHIDPIRIASASARKSPWPIPSQSPSLRPLPPTSPHTAPV